MERSKLTNHILSEKRRPFIDMKNKLRQEIVLYGLAKYWDEAILLEAKDPNTLRIIEANEWFLCHDHHSSRDEMIRACLNVFACTYESDRFYKFRFNKWLKHLINSGFDFNMVYVDDYWNEATEDTGS